MNTIDESVKTVTTSNENLPQHKTEKSSNNYCHYVVFNGITGIYFVEDENTHLYGIVKSGSGGFEMLLPCVIETFSQPCNEVVYFTSGTHQDGLWHLHYGVIVPPVYDKIEFLDLGKPILFTKDGVQGYVDFNNNFVPKSEVDAIEDEAERHDRLLEFLCEDSEY